MGEPEQFAKRTFAEDTERITGGAAAWQDPPEIGLSHVQGDGMLVVRQPARLSRLAAPWSAASKHDEALLELKMVGDHLDVPAVERALLRRQARQVQRVEAAAKDRAPWPGQEPLWMVAPHLPAWLRAARKVVRFAKGCYRVGPAWFELVCKSGSIPSCRSCSAPTSSMRKQTLTPNAPCFYWPTSGGP